MVKMENEFGVWDYLVFAAMLLISVGIGIYFALRGGGQKTQGEYLLANRNMTILPVAISILVSFISAILILGTPAEMYTQGTEYAVSVVGKGLGIAIAAVFFVPLLYPLKITSVFEYLEMRFNSRAARLTGSCLMITAQVMYMGIASFAPATAFEAMTGFPVWGTILISGVVSTFYTSIGGMKAVVWTDVFQSFVMLAGILAVVIQGIIQVGGMDKVWDINERWNRIRFFNFDPDPTVRHTVWNLTIGAALGNVSYGINQASVQRYSSLPTLGKAIKCVLLNIIGVAVLVLSTCLAGIVLFAYYANKGCDPLGLGYVDNSNQLVPYFVMETLNYPAVPGLFVSCLFSGALSSVSSSLNALAAVTWEDILKARYDKHWTEYKKTAVTKLMVVVYGCLAVGVSFIVQNLEGTVLQASNSFIGSVSGPLTGMFILGAFFPWANSYGAIIGAICGVSISMWLSVGTYVTGIPLLELPHPNGTCSDNDVTIETVSTAAVTLATVSASSTTAGSSDRSGLETFYSISYMWFPTVGITTSVIVGLVVSFITGANGTYDVPTKYQIPVFSRLCCCLPKSVLYKLNCHRYFMDSEDSLSEDGSTEILIKPSSEDTSFNGEWNKSHKTGSSNKMYHETGSDADDVIRQKPQWYGAVPVTWNSGHS